MTYIPISPNERDAMLKTIGVKNLDDRSRMSPPSIASPNSTCPLR